MNNDKLTNKQLKNLMKEEYTNIILEAINGKDCKPCNQNQSEDAIKNRKISRLTDLSKDDKKAKDDNFNPSAKIRFKSKIEKGGEPGQVIVIPPGLEIKDKKGVIWTVKELYNDGVSAAPFGKKAEFISAAQLEDNFDVR
jgi:hypothetical protein